MEEEARLAALTGDRRDHRQLLSMMAAEEEVRSGCEGDGFQTQRSRDLPWLAVIFERKRRFQE